MDFICPVCESDNIQRLSIIYEGGLSEINTESKGAAIGIGQGGIGVAAGGTNLTGTSQTAASKKAAPPAKKAYIKPLLGIFGVFILLSILINSKNSFVTGAMSIGWLTASAIWIYHSFQYNAKTWPPLKNTWDNSYLCYRCNEIFIPRDS